MLGGVLCRRTHKHTHIHTHTHTHTHRAGHSHEPTASSERPSGQTGCRVLTDEVLPAARSWAGPSPGEAAFPVRL